MMGKKRKLNDKGRVVNDEWFVKYFVVQQSEKAFCLIWYFTFWKYLLLHAIFFKNETLQGKQRGHLSDKHLKIKIRLACSSVKVNTTKAGKDVQQQKSL